MRHVLCSAILVIAGCADIEASEVGGPGSLEVRDRGELHLLDSSPLTRTGDGGATRSLGRPSFEHLAFLKATSDRFVEFGFPIAMDGDTVIVGAPLTNVTESSDGAAFVFVRANGVWTQQARLIAPPGQRDEGAFFGTSVSIQGDVVAVGAPLLGNGVVNIFERSGTVWTLTATLRPLFQQLDALGEFGQAVRLDGDRLAIGALGDSSGSTGVGGDPTNQDAPFSGAAYVYVRNGAGWDLDAYIKPSNTAPDRGFGSTLSLSGDTLAVGSGDDSSATGVNGDDRNTDSPGSGAVFVFERGADGWAQRAYIKASNTDAGDRFGIGPGDNVSLSGGRLAVSALGESSAATGVDGDQTSNDALDSGAVYVFRRSGSTWAQEAYLKASNTESGDSFGYRIALSGDSLAVSAPGEASAATGIDGDQTSNEAISAGAAYFFDRCGAWTQTQYIKATNTAARDLFGWGLAWDGHILAVGSEGQYTCPDPDPDSLCLRRGAVYVLGR